MGRSGSPPPAPPETPATSPPPPPATAATDLPRRRPTRRDWARMREKMLARGVRRAGGGRRSRCRPPALQGRGRNRPARQCGRRASGWRLSGPLQCWTRGQITGSQRLLQQGQPRVQPVQDRSSPGDGGNPGKFGGMEIAVKVGRIHISHPHPHSLPASRPEDPARQGNRGSAAREIRRRGGAGGAGGRLVVIYGRSDSRSWVASACPRVRAWVLGKPEGPPAPRLDQFRAAVAAEEGRGRRDLLTNVAVNTSGFPGELFQQAGRDRYFEWQATPFLTPGICGVPTALRRA
ncbi:unnamed protein product [Rangifer tarandus platyrhynchus]|uniref:Uncharacterized protein n=2 Tax=Rangifer tarandus platyrhynchus TaxID=3082113 RepID=A0ACB0E7Z1_RANTA|nr:unnamed protein product [Rangifer tarandus platyrhynchus]CAI9696626.1 unnamed protein product [Rangifer tarandus platyrhynchus]